MKITGGFFKGRNLFYKKSTGCRPTQSIVREAIFDMLAGNIEGKDVADFFAGTGALGFEALSRGAKTVTFVDNSRQAIKMLEKNVELFNLKNHTKIIKMDVEKAVKKLNEESVKFDLVFVDPPYKIDYKTIKNICCGVKSIIKNQGFLILETEKKHRTIDLPEFEKKKEKIYGSTKIQIYQVKTTNGCISR